ncbi:hypothetical protein EDD65_102205 [Keratinibaculum paraultunense]|uniref:Purine nucleoside phosphorylase n=1 Tax=Keratinibaculum paraultunense TaxID=1278232 RepID=A0A4R3L3S6_9FIRM|nr:peptidoglycan editing factor PgeF [Keratinibaculum paraultunense]QQY80548.1 peptidoglycan editing factor PgeF [Keratinibaculum paraultunense]TCS91273.1 hypothetical protein EDD65_102205 [Keratinibaculum paraultunense]
MEIIERIEDGLTFFQMELFYNRNVSHLFTSRLGWENNKVEKLLKLFNVPEENIIGLTQVHGTNILVVDEDIKNNEKTANIKADGMITNVPNIVLITYHADCVPIYFYDYNKKVIGLAHGGWKGTYGNISGKMLDLMIDRYNSNIDNVLVGIGPSIGPCCYEVGKDLAFQFMNKYNKFDNIIEKRHNKLYLDLWKVNYLQIRDKGVRKENIAVTKACTSCHNDKFYSYRKEKGTKNRMIAAIKINS